MMNVMTGRREFLAGFAAFTELKGPGFKGDQRCQFTRSYASVSETGEVSALRPGDITVLAMDRMFNKEIFGVRIS